MKKILSAFLTGLVFLLFISWTNVKTDTLSDGNQPQVSTDSKGIVRVVFGQKDKIFCSTSSDKGVTFSKPVLVAQVSGMHLGMSRGPQLASSANYSVITAMDKSGNIHWFRLIHATAKWKNMGTVNDLKESAPEGLMGITANTKDNFYAVWLDIRNGKHNQIYFSSLPDHANQWTKNTLAYRSPDEHVCECCKPNIAVQGSGVAIMFRNWLNGSRDLYVIKSSDQGRSFKEAQKLGTDTWKLNGCPMDGGGIIIDQANLIQTTWQRKGSVYYCKAGQPEVCIGKGRTPAISGTGAKTVLTYQSNDTLKLVNLKNNKIIEVGNGSFLKSTILPDNKILCVWEQDNKIKFKRI